MFKTTLESVKKQPKSEKQLDVLSKKLFPSESHMYNVGDAVFTRNFGKGEPWIEGKVSEVLGVRNYLIEIKDFGNILW